MKDVKASITKHYGSVANFSDIMSIHFRAGMNIMPLLRHWKDEVNWKFAKGEPRGYHAGTVWICHDDRTDKLFVRFHSGDAQVEKDHYRNKRLADISTGKTRTVRKVVGLGNGAKRRFDDGLNAAFAEAKEKGEVR